MRKGSSLLAGATKAASYNMILQFSTRIMTFILNAFVLRYVSRDMLGVVNVRLTLLYTTGLFVSREAFVKASLSQTHNRQWPQVINLLWFILPLSLLCCSFLAGVWICLLEIPDPNLVPYYNFGVVAFAVSTVIESVAQPLWVIGQAFLFVKLRIILDSIFLTIRAILTVILVLQRPDLGLIIFSVAQVLSMIIYTCLYFAYFSYYINVRKKKDEDFPFSDIRDLFPKRQKGESLIDFSMASLTWSFLKQSFLKQILTEGERYVMTIFRILSFGDQGIYDIINNLGSLAARFIFCPIEESGYLFFSQSLQRGVELEKQEKESALLATEVLQYLLKTVTLTGAIIMVYGYSYSFLVLDLYGGSLLSSSTGPTLLRWYCLYVLVIAVNGVTECFVFATMSKDEVDRYNYKMLLFSLLFLASSWYLTQIVGSVGFILANCFNMIARIFHSIYFIHHYFRNSPTNPLKGALTSPQVLGGFLVAFLITVISESCFCCDKGIARRLLHIVIGVVCLCMNLLIILLFEKDFITFIVEKYLARRRQGRDDALAQKRDLTKHKVS